ncbi:hypothetical protein F0U60_49310 [Archangium minus]|uniref:HEAT repeat domain-containing protein n=1 Tax=Archangium minus TaxID=83450 RepID=A0ABY9X777_9BACT|nr:hypothetical protein F0U60_49310 [Archangium minus]
MIPPRFQDELIDAVHEGDELRARGLVAQLAVQPRQARAILEAMLAAPDALVRQAAAFGLGELGGRASAKRLEQQLALEEARGDYDGESVVEAITRALGRIDDASARASLMRKLERLATGPQESSDVGTVVNALWRKRHPEMIPAVRRCLERFDPSTSKVLQGLLVLLEKTPEEVSTWAGNPSVPVAHKTEVLTVLDAELPDALAATLPSFISAAHALAETAARQNGEASYYCDRLFTLLLLYKERVLPALPKEARAELRDLTRTLVAATAPNCSLRAAILLKLVGRPEDASLIEAHRPTEPVLAKVFDDAARTLRGLQEE